MPLWISFIKAVGRDRNKFVKEHQIHKNRIHKNPMVFSMVIALSLQKAHQIAHQIFYYLLWLTALLSALHIKPYSLSWHLTVQFIISTHQMLTRCHVDCQGGDVELTANYLWTRNSLWTGGRGHLLTYFECLFGLWRGLSGWSWLSYHCTWMHLRPRPHLYPKRWLSLDSCQWNEWETDCPEDDDELVCSNCKCSMYIICLLVKTDNSWNVEGLWSVFEQDNNLKCDIVCEGREDEQIADSLKL